MSTIPWRFIVASLCLAGCVISLAPAGAQTSVSRPIVSNVELVQIPVIVFDEKGGIAADLQKNDFRLTEDGVVQQILYLDRVRIPVSFVILADLSSSMMNKIPFVQNAAISLLDPPSKPDFIRDEYSVLAVGSRAHQLVAFTRDQQDLAERLPLLLTDMYERTALFDGIYLGATIADQQASNRRRAMIIISDGGDNHSRYNIHETSRLLEEADVPVFAIMAGPEYEFPAIFPAQRKKRAQGGPLGNFPPFGTGDSDADYIGPAERNGPHNLSVLTEATGGGVFTAKKDEDIARIARTIGQAVRYQYVLSFKPLRDIGPEAKSFKSSDKALSHKIHVELYPKENFKGYSVPYYKHLYDAPE